MEKHKNIRSLFSNYELGYFVPQSILYPTVAAFRALVNVEENGRYGWTMDPLEVWAECKESLTNSIFDELKSVRGNANTMVTHKTFWASLYGTILLHTLEPNG